MNVLPFILVFIINSVPTKAQTLESILNPSFRFLQEQAHQISDVSCFDYEEPLPVVLKTDRVSRECEPKFKPLPVGRFRVMSKNNYRSGNYVLSRTAEKKYQAILNLEFMPEKEPDTGRAGTVSLAQQMLKRTRNCMKEMRPYLLGPNGEELEIIILNEKDSLPKGMQKPPESTIRVSYQGSQYRGNANNFGSSFECTTIGHEILHHLGLCDEYYEGVIQTPGFPDSDWSCRPVTAQNSYMRNMKFAFESTVPLTSRCECDSGCMKIMKAGGNARNVFLSMNGAEILSTEMSVMSSNNTLNPDREICKMGNPELVDTGKEPAKGFEFDSQNGNVYKFSSYRVFAKETIYYDRVPYTCECRPHQTYCHKIMEQMKAYAQNNPPRATCPDGLKSKSTGPSIGTDPKGTRIDCQKNSSGETCDLVITTRGTNKSLLSPQQFNRILGGDCSGSAPQYEKCEKFAYMSGSDPECKKMPKECLDDNFYLNGVTNQ